MEEAIERVLTRLHAEMERENELRHILSKEDWALRRPDLMLAIGESAGRFLNFLIKSTRSTRVLEVGTSVGYSTLWLAEAVRATGGRVVSLDINPSKQALAAQNLEAAGLRSFVELIADDAVTTLGSMTAGFDFVLLDAERSQHVDIFKAFHPKVLPGGIVVTDNITFPKPEESRPYLEHIRNHPDYTVSMLLEIENGLELSLKRSV
ncbi:MAG: class I SAM-dependent methyltransferase [Deltaproteobacteria bacterium]|nr:class I SAM-dependent methyltransferase [Deltaproteobacteria bacterium]